MRLISRPGALLAALLAAAAFQLAWAYPQLPETVATHFDGAGRANGWMPRDTFVAFQVGLISIMLVSFVGLPRWLGRLPAQSFSLPHRDYWLAPERRDQTLAAIRRQMMWLACAIVGMIVAITHLVIETNLASRPALPSATMWVLLAAFLIFTAVWTGRFVLRFRRPGRS